MAGTKRTTREQLWLAIRLPHIPLDVQGGEHSATPIVVSEKKRRVEVVVCCNEAASAAGATFGMDCLKAELLSDCLVLQRDRALELRKLTELADGLYQFTPNLEIYECESIAQAGVLLEVSRSLSLFRGRLNLLKDVRSFMALTECCYEVGVAHSAKAAWMLSWANQVIAGDDVRADFIKQLKPLPVGLLHEHPEAVSMLEKTGFAKLGDLAKQIEAGTITGFKKRLSQAFIDELCDVFGIDQVLQQKSLFQKPVSHYQPKETYCDETQFDYPIANTDLLHLPIETALQNLSDYLRKRQLECHQVLWCLHDIHDRREQMIVRCDSGQSDWRLLYDLTLIQLDNCVLSFEVDRLTLECPDTTPVQNLHQTLNLAGSHTGLRGPQELEIALAKIRARLGDSAVFKVSYCDHHVPELMGETVSVNTTCNQSLPPELTTAIRPAWVFAQPYKAEVRSRGIYWRGYLELLIGPERIHNDWWKTPGARDYYLARRDDAARFWVFQDVYEGSWYVQGVFA